MLPRDIDLKSNAKVHENLIKMLRLRERRIGALTLATSVSLRRVIISDSYIHICSKSSWNINLRWLGAPPPPRLYIFQQQNLLQQTIYRVRRIHYILVKYFDFAIL